MVSDVLLVVWLDCCLSVGLAASYFAVSKFIPRIIFLSYNGSRKSVY
jgi:hypothetical protein